MSLLLDKHRYRHYHSCTAAQSGSVVNEMSKMSKSMNKNDILLLKMCKKGRFKEAKSLLTNGANVNYVDKQGDYPLYLATGSGHKDVAELLISYGADPNFDGGASLQDSWHHYALICAVAHGHKEIVELLINNGADVNIKTDYNLTSLWSASYSGHKEIVELLISKGADISVKHSIGTTALMAASEQGHKEIAHLLLLAEKDGAKILEKVINNSEDKMSFLKKLFKKIVKKQSGKDGESNGKSKVKADDLAEIDSIVNQLHGCFKKYPPDKASAREIGEVLSNQGGTPLMFIVYQTFASQCPTAGKVLSLESAWKGILGWKE